MVEDRYSMLDTRCWILDAGYSMLDARCWVLVAGGWMIDAGCWIPTSAFCEEPSEMFIPALGNFREEKQEHAYINLHQVSV